MKLFKRLRNSGRVNMKDKFQDMLVNSLVENEIYAKSLIERALRLENFTEDGVAYFRDRHDRRYVFGDENAGDYRFLGN